VDLVVASDGINSGLREADPLTFGTTIDVGRNYYMWLGTRSCSARPVRLRAHRGRLDLAALLLPRRARQHLRGECPPETWHGSAWTSSALGSA